MTDDAQLHRSLERIEQLVAELHQIEDQPTRSRAVELIQSIMDFHGQGLDRLLTLLTESGPAGQAAISQLAQDELVSSLLLLYGLHPVDLPTRVHQALEKVRPYLKSHGGNVELVGIEQGIVHLRMQGSCHGCPSSAVTMKTAIEEAILAQAPDIAGLNVEGIVDEPPKEGFVPIESLYS